MLAPTDAGPRGSAPTIAALALFFLGAMALSIPAAPIEAGTGGLLVGPGQVSEQLAEALGRAGYGHVAVDLGGADLDDALWRDRLEDVRRRSFPVWGWIGSDAGSARISALLHALSLSGLYVYGPDAVVVARAVRSEQPRLEVVPVLRFGDAEPAGAGHAVAMDPATFLREARNVARPVLLADRLDAASIREARETVGGRCLVARIPVGPPGR